MLQNNSYKLFPVDHHLEKNLFYRINFQGRIKAIFLLQHLRKMLFISFLIQQNMNSSIKLLILRMPDYKTLSSKMGEQTKMCASKIVLLLNCFTVQRFLKIKNRFLLQKMFMSLFACMKHTWQFILSMDWFSLKDQWYFILNSRKYLSAFSEKFVRYSDVWIRRKPKNR